MLISAWAAAGAKLVAHPIGDRASPACRKSDSALEGDYQLRNAAATFKACLGVVALSWAMAAFGQSAGTQAAIVAQHAPSVGKTPAILLLKENQSQLASTCGGGAFDVNTFINVDGSASADVKVSAPGVGQIEEFTDETGANIGPYQANFPTFHILPFGGGLPPNTPITVTITTYSGSNLTGRVTAVSSLTFDCTTGVVLNAPVNATEPIPTLSSFALAATAGLLLLFGALALRRGRAS